MPRRVDAVAFEKALGGDVEVTRAPETLRALLVVEDDPAARATTVAAFGRDWAVIEAGTAEMAADLLRTHHEVQAILLDLELHGDGLDLLNEVRHGRHLSLPILILSDRDDPIDRVVALRMGADDYIVRPFDPAELRARVDAVLRRATPELQPAPVLQVGPLTISTPAREADIDGTPVALTPREFDLLAFFAHHPRQVFTREQLVKQAWFTPSEWQTPANVTEHIRKLRAKLEAAGAPRGWITTVRGVGYRFDP